MSALIISFRGKPEAIWHGEVKRLRVKVPEIARSHCDMSAFRNSRRFGSYANSDLFPALLARELKAMKLPPYLYADELPPGVEMDTTKFLWAVKITVADQLPVTAGGDA